MKVIKPSVEIFDNIDGEQILLRLERAGRVCYKSEEKITPDSAQQFIRNILKSGHESVIEHEKVTCKVICDRGVSHEIVRHRLASYSQESTRYCNYASEKHGAELTYILPCFFETDSLQYKIWEKSMQDAEAAYFALLESGATPEKARSVLPNSLKTEIVITMNLREWRHFFRLRTSKAAHPQIREISGMILAEFKANIPIIFDEI